MLCIVDKSLSVSMTLRMCLRELCCLFGIFYCLDLPLGKDGLLIHSGLNHVDFGKRKKTVWTVSTRLHKSV